MRFHSSIQGLVDASKADNAEVAEAYWRARSTCMQKSPSRAPISTQSIGDRKRVSFTADQLVIPGLTRLTK